MRVAAITGFSGSGKTTLLVALIHHYVARGQRVGAIKHTHHTLNEQHKGDTARLLEAGASPVILAGDETAVIFTAGDTARIAYESPEELLAHFTTDIVLIEGFKHHHSWPRIELDGTAWPIASDVVANLDRIWRS